MSALLYVLGLLFIIVAVLWFLVAGRPWAQPGAEAPAANPVVDVVRSLVGFAQRFASVFLPGVALLLAGLLFFGLGALVGHGGDNPPPPPPVAAGASATTAEGTAGPGGAHLDDPADDVCTAWEQYDKRGRPAGPSRDDLVRTIKYTGPLSTIQPIKAAAATFSSAPVTDDAAFKRAGDTFMRACVAAGWTSSGGSAGGVGGKP